MGICRCIMIDIEQLRYSYKRLNEEGNTDNVCTALDSVDMHVKKGDFVAILGANGSGKSTLAKHINALLYPDAGTITVNGMNAADPAKVWDVRRSAGMIFQNPDNQIVASVVEEDVAFGPENLGIPRDEIIERVKESLEAVGMGLYRSQSPNSLSGGQKQRVAIAGVLAMEPECLIMDEPTAMLDPIGRRETIEAALKMNREKGKTVLLITHYMEEAVQADYCFVMDHGRILMEGKPSEIFARGEELLSARLCLPCMVEVAYRLRKAGIGLSPDIMDMDTLVDEILRLGEKNGSPKSGFTDKKTVSEKENRELIIQLKNVSHIYNKGLSTETAAVNGVDLCIYRGEFVGLIGHTGSGKSTLIQHLNGLLKPTDGEIIWYGDDKNGENIHGKGFSLRKLRSRVGMVFQYPEHQLFGETVLKDVCFGPEQLGKKKEEVMSSATGALRAVGVDESLFEASPFDLSGGQKRRVAVAGVLAMDPEVLILDEPAAGLDPKGRDEILDMISRLRTERGITIIMVSHSMEDVSRYADRLLVADHGRLIIDGIPEEVFAQQTKELEDTGLMAPQVTYLMKELNNKGFSVNEGLVTIEDAVEEILDKCFARSH